MCETRDAAIILAQVCQLSAVVCSPSAKSAIPLTMSHSSSESNAAVKTPEIWNTIRKYILFKKSSLAYKTRV